MTLAAATAELRDAQHAFDFMIANWQTFSPEEVSEAAARWWYALKALREAITVGAS